MLLNRRKWERHQASIQNLNFHRARSRNLLEMKLLNKQVSLVSCILLFCLATLGSADEYHRTPQRKPDQKNRAITEDATFWRTTAQQLLKNELIKKPILSKAKNVILFLGDGMSISTVTAARIYKGQKAGKTGEEEQLTFDQFPYTALSRTYCTNAQIADSACSATAYLCGVKTDIDTLGLDFNVEYRNCETQQNTKNHVSSIMAWAQTANKGTGIVTTTRVTHATPAGSYAHAANRDWESDYDQYLNDPDVDSDTCDDIAEQLIRNSPGKNFKVILGGGRSYFLPNSTEDPEKGTGRRLDNVNLVEEWEKNHSDGVYVIDRDQLLNLELSKKNSVLGLFSPSHLEYFLESGTAKNPTLAEMTEVAIRMLQKEENGFVLLVEGGRIDQAHHDGRAKLALEEAIQFDLAIAAALNMTNRQETLIVVTADHSHTMTINGYSHRGNDLLGLSDDIGDDELPYVTLSYANGPGYNTTFANGERINLTDVDTTADSYKQPAGVPIYSETHGGDDVAIFAIGPHAHLFQGVYEQHYIAHVMGYAACIGEGLKSCDADTTSSSNRPLVGSYYVFSIQFILLGLVGRLFFLGF